MAHGGSRATHAPGRRTVSAVRPPDPAFVDPRLAALYDVLDDDRGDLDAYVAIADEVAARRVVDVGCGTGSLAVRLVGRGRTLIGVEPAAVSLQVARAKPHAEHVTWSAAP